MATVTGTIARPDVRMDVRRQFAADTWTPLLNGDVGDAFELSDFADKSVQVDGTFGVGGSVTLQGSNDLVNWYALSDPQGVALTFTAAGLKAVGPATRYVRPNVTAGDGTTSLTVTLFAKE